MLKVDRHPGKARAVLHRRRHPVGEGRPSHRPAMLAAAGMRPMLGHLQRARFGQIEDLAGNRRSCHGRFRQGRAASLAGRRDVVLHLVRVIRPVQRLALVAGLPTRLATRFAPQAPGSPLRPRFFQSIARRRFAAVATGQSETALQLLYTLDKPLVLLLQQSVLLPKPGVLHLQPSDLLLGSLRRCTRRRAARRLGISHVPVDSFPKTRVNPLVTHNNQDNLGSYHYS